MRLISIFAILVCCLVRQIHGEIIAIGDLPGGVFNSQVTGVSADGSVVVGESTSALGREPFRWTSGGGIVGLGDLPGGTFGGTARGLSANGLVVVGNGVSTSGNEAFRWTNGGMVGLGDLPGGVFYSIAEDASGDGSVVVGTSSSNNGGEGFRWTSGGIVGLGDLPGGSFLSNATAVSDDGLVVVGVGTVNNDASEAFRWTSSGGMVGLGDLPGGAFSSIAYNLSGDGSVVVGVGLGSSGAEAFRWTSSGGMIGLGDLPGGSFSSFAFGVSEDGSVVVGFSMGSNGREAFLWTEAEGISSLRDFLFAQGDDLSHWQSLDYAIDVSADGRTIVGYGINADGNTEGFVATVDLGATFTPPSSFAVTNGNLVSGSIADLLNSDDMDLSVRRSTTDTLSRVFLEIESASPTPTPGTFEFSLEASVFARGPVTQSIDLYDFDAETWETVDVRNASRFVDATTVAVATGDLARFVEVGTNRVVSRCRFESTNRRRQFTANVDQAFWMIAN